ncbi:MAG: hypothetical protein HN509_15370 [Halobacteriovoraceae bacterium]|nr:hypothetical protein [Halobacteriovoraceae bacterium]MBT5095184.1 hypothetical protein [Halobacteriovoraceae bacterium]
MLIHKRLKGPGELGPTLSGLDDSYLCASKKYFKFFTGIDVHLYDFKTTSVPAHQKAYLKYRQFIIKVGRQLRKDQSLEKLIERILNSEFYSLQNFGTQVVKNE